MAQTMTGESALRSLLTPKERVQLDIAIEHCKHHDTVTAPIKNDQSPAGFIFHAFTWRETPQGADYWSRIHQRLRVQESQCSETYADI